MDSRKILVALTSSSLECQLARKIKNQIESGDDDNFFSTLKRFYTLRIIRLIAATDQHGDDELAAAGIQDLALLLSAADRDAVMFAVYRLMFADVRDRIWSDVSGGVGEDIGRSEISV